MKFRSTYIIFLILLTAEVVLGQQKTIVSLTLDEAFSLAKKNSQQLKVSRKSTEIAAQGADIQNLNKLPSISTSLNYGYISNSQIWTPDFSQHSTAKIPPHLTQLSLQASQLIYKGGEVKNSIAQSVLEKEFYQVSNQREQVEILTQVAFDYLEIFNLINQGKVLSNNLTLARQRLKNILTLQQQGMVTNNDVLRTKLQISDLELAIRRNTNSRDVRNVQLNMILGISQGSMLSPDTALIQQHTHDDRPIGEFLKIALANNQSIKLARIDSNISIKNLNRIKSNRYPELSIFAASNLQRPFLNTVPAIDIYSNTWQAGISLKYNISSIYQAPKKIRDGKLRLEQAILKQDLQSQQLKVALNTAFVNYNEARDELATYRKDQIFARENYRIVERKYLNQLSLLADMIDAANIKTEAELKVSNSEIKVVYTFYQLSKILGTL